MEMTRRSAVEQIEPHLGGADNVAHVDSNPEGFTFEIYDASVVSITEVRACECVEEAALKEKTVDVTLVARYRESLTLEPHTPSISTAISPLVAGSAAVLLVMLCTAGVYLVFF